MRFKMGPRRDTLRDWRGMTGSRRYVKHQAKRATRRAMKRLVWED